VFVPGGVGGLAAGVLSWFWEKQGGTRPVMVVVEPERAARLFESARAGELRTYPGDLDTIIAGLACGEPSLLAWELLGSSTDAFMKVTDSAVAATMRDMAKASIVSGESGAAALAAFERAAVDPAMRALLRLGTGSRVVCLSTEGATDPDIYFQIVGQTAKDVLLGASA